MWDTGEEGERGTYVIFDSNGSCTICYEVAEDALKRGRCSSLCLRPSVQTLSKAFETSLSVTVSIVFLLWAICDIVSWKVARAV